MIHRTFIRTKVLQILYAHYQKGNKDLKVAENELNLSLQKTHYLYYYLLLLVIEFTDAEQKKLDKQKYSSISEEQHINGKFADNFLMQHLRNHTAFMRFINKHGNELRNNNKTDFIELLFNEIKKSDNYTKYISSNNTYKNDCKFWKAVFEQIILKSSIVSEWLEQKSIYWNDDLETISVFVLKTLKRFQDKSVPVLLPLFKDDASKEYTIQLLRFSIIEAEKNSNLINTQMKNWDKERIALVDLIIMQMALAEMNNFPTIPLKVTLSEYIDLARYYSTPQSTSFVNGILQAIVSLLKISKN